MACEGNVDEIRKILECAICLQPVDNPKTLICHHSYCKRCLDGLLQFDEDGAATIKCPKGCNDLTVITADKTTNDLGIEYMLKQIVDMINNKNREHEKDLNNKHFKCESEKKCVREADAYCVLCDLLSCKYCGVKHDSCAQINAISPVRFVAADEQIHIFCRTHATDADYMCLSCNNEMACIYCIHRHHRYHAYDTVGNQASKLRQKLSAEIEKMGTYIKDVNVKLRKAEQDILFYQVHLQKLLNSRKVKCIRDYINYLNQEEERIKEEFNTTVSCHIQGCFTNFVDPSSSYKEYISKDDFKLVLQKDLVTSSVEGLGKGKTKQSNKIEISISNHAFDTKHPLGNLNIANGKASSDDQTLQSVTSTLPLEELEGVPRKLHDNVLNLCDSVTHLQ